MDRFAFMKKRHLFLIACQFFVSNVALSQSEKCQVAIESLKGTYQGDCISGWAHGKGKAVGKDQYDGDFKSGLPDGFGTYTWEDKNYYTGNWKKGYRQGTGEFHYLRPYQEDSVLIGFWKKDKYMGRYEKAFVVNSMTSHVTKVDCKLIDKTGNDINITFHQLQSQTSRGTRVPLPELRAISVINGTYYAKTNRKLSNVTSTLIQDITFPFRAIFYINNGEEVEITFNENGDYEVYIDIH